MKNIAIIVGLLGTLIAAFPALTESRLDVSQFGELTLPDYEQPAPEPTPDPAANQSGTTDVLSVECSGGTCRLVRPVESIASSYPVCADGQCAFTADVVASPSDYTVVSAPAAACTCVDCQCGSVSSYPVQYGTSTVRYTMAAPRQTQVTTRSRTFSRVRGQPVRNVFRRLFCR